MAASAFSGLAHWATLSHIAALLVLYMAGGALAFPIALLAATLVSGTKGFTQRFATFFLALAVATGAVTAALFALEYRAYYAQWHAGPFSFVWILQFVFTLASAAYQFAVIGLRLYFPIGLLGLFAASIWFAARPR
ncbi:hypothetical protein [Chelativorans sp. Marseille-P2723]|uniref:hypothetical protein n=1 Tax=Chelativorans sp. Marseille-P2723 TaxID=2709133 RepID=UPI001FEEC6D5|nr:hypothetical protein [Chelativorans sp. Marseille-P2723]